MKTTLKAFLKNHPDDQPPWYRILRGVFYMTITVAGVFATTLTIWFLTTKGDLTPQDAQDLAFAFEIYSYLLMTGFVLAGIEILGPHWIAGKLKAAWGWLR